MTIKKSLFATALAAVALSVSAQKTAGIETETVTAPESKTVYNVVPGWYVQAQFGGQYTLGETSCGKLMSPNFQVGVGYNFGKVIGARFAVNAWQSKAGVAEGNTNLEWKWNYVAPMFDATFNLSNLISGVNPNRLVDVSAFVGAGVNIAFGNDEANALYNAGNVMYLKNNWEGTKISGLGRVGALVDFKVSKKVSVNVEFSANMLSDQYNSKRAHNVDWYFNGLVGAKYTFGKVYKATKVELPKQIVYKDKIVEKVVEKIVEKPVEKKVLYTRFDTVQVNREERQPLHMEIFFNLAGFKLMGSEAQKVKEVANYLNKWSDAKLTIMGLCDKGTGTDAINIPLSEKRALLVKDLLVKQYGIPADRIVTKGLGSSIQPYEVPELNRVAVCEAE